MIFVDSSVWIDWFRGNATPQAGQLERLLTREPLVVGDLVLAEVLQGILHEDQFRRVRSRLLALNVVEVAGTEMALKAVDNYRSLRRLGITPRGTVDTLIATRCIEEDWPLLTGDRDFAPFAEHLGLTLL